MKSLTKRTISKYTSKDRITKWTWKALWLYMREYHLLEQHEEITNQSWSKLYKEHLKW